jgi:hypothetical protein
MPSSTPQLSYENAAGQVLAHPAGYAQLIYKPGPRSLADLQALITQIGQLLIRHNWYRMLGDQRFMTPLLPEQSTCLVAYWTAYTQQRPRQLYAAVVLAQDVFARLAVSQLRQTMSGTKITYGQFADELAATAWLAQC